jgi:alkylation response protein AidB-like acyl-CoA dehydrogenase
MVNSGEATKLLEAAKAFRPRILGERDRIEAGRRLPEGLTRALARAGFLRIFLPSAYDGVASTQWRRTLPWRGACGTVTSTGRRPACRTRLPKRSSPTRT